MTARVGRHGCQAAAGAAGARRALCLLALAHALAGASAQAPKPLWGKDLAQGGKTRGPAPKKRPDFSALAAKMGKASKPSGKPMKDGDRQKQPPPGSQLKGPLKSGSWKDKGKARPPEDAQPWGAAAKKGFGKPSKLLAQDMKRKMMEAKKGGAGKKFKSHQDVSDMKRRAMGKKPPLKGLPKLPPKRLNPFNGKKAASSIVFINEAPDAKDVDIFWVKSKKPPWPPLPGRKPEDVVQVRCRFGRRSGKAVQTAEELKNDLQVRGEFNITVRTDWAPIGSGHFLELVKHGFFNGTSIFRAVKGFLAQFGVSHNSTLQQRFGNSTIKDDRPRPWLQPLRRGTVAFAGSSGESRTSQMWIVFADGVAGDQALETPSIYIQPPIGYIQARDGLDALDDINTEYGDLAAFNGSAPDPQLMEKEDGLDYLLKGWPNLEYFESCAITGNAEQEIPGSPVEEEELVGTVEAGKQLTQQTTRGASFTARLKGSTEVLQRVVVKKPREFVQLSAPVSSEL